MGTNGVIQALASHEPVSGPDYVPWWARGEYAKKMQTSYTTESGVSVVAGEVSGRKAVVREKIERKESPNPGIEIPNLPLPELCDKFSLSHDLYKTAPNGGVATMRVRNAVRKLLAT